MAYQVSPGVNVSEIDLTTIVPGVSSSVGAIAGIFRWGPVGERVLVSSETQLVSSFGKPTSLNPETFLTAANFLNYGAALQVVRSANTTAGNANAAMNAVANTVAANTANCVVKNATDYSNRVSFEAGALFVAKYPGDIGNSLRISVCDSVTEYSSNINLSATVSGNTVVGGSSLAIGSNTATFTFLVSANATLSNTAANTAAAQISVGDNILFGNSSIGAQYLTVATKGAVSTNGSTNVASFAVTFTDKYKLSTDWVANTTVNGNTTVTTVQRFWEFFNIVDVPPTTSDWVAQYGNTAAVDTLHIVITDQDGVFTGTTGSILEVHEGLSRATDARTADGATLYYKTVLNNNSKYIWFANDSASAPSANSLLVASSSATVPTRLDFTNGSDGFSESNAPLNIIASGYDLFASPEAVDISLILQGKPIGGSTSIGGMTTTRYQLANYINDNIASVRKDCMVFVTPDDSMVTGNAGQEAQALVNWHNALTDSNFMVVDSGYKYMYDRYNDVYRYVPLNGDIAGLCARTDQTNDSWWSPAGYNRGNIKNIVKLRFNPSKAERDLLYKNSVNPVVSFPGQGTILYGDKTSTTKPSAFGYINVRRLFITLEKAIAQVSKYSLFEFNDEFTRSQFRNMITSYLRDVQARRGITDFQVVCDNTNNTPERIDRGEFWGDIYLKPNRSINFIQLNFVAVRSGVQFSTVIGKF